MLTILKVKTKLSLSNFKGSNYLQCPQCGKKRLKPYAYDDGRIESEILGRCQREVNCNYHLKPSEYFKDKGENFHNTREYSTPEPKETFFLDKTMCESISGNFKNSTLLTFFQRTGIDFTPIFEKYKVGASPAGATVFFQFDGAKFRDGKIIKYLENGHRDKSSGMPVTWIHKSIPEFNEKKHQIRQCFFGRHLLDGSNTVCIVESEKTAVLCSGVFKSATWMATGGRTQLNEF